MDLKIKDHRFVVCGASSGFGKSITTRLVDEGAQIIAIARKKNQLEELQEYNPDSISIVAGDLRKEETHNEIETAIGNSQLHGILFNAGGPPAMGALETTMTDWDEAYQLVMRWKIDLALRLILYFKPKNYGRILFLESQSVKQPIENLVLSNAFRLGIVGFAKTVAQELAEHQVTVNVLAPGSHNTPAIERVINKVAETDDINENQAREKMEAAIPVGRMGEPEELATLAAWLLSPHSSFVTGQTISHDGGNISGVFG